MEKEKKKRGRPPDNWPSSWFLNTDEGRAMLRFVAGGNPTSERSYRNIAYQLNTIHAFCSMVERGNERVKIAGAFWNDLFEKGTPGCKGFFTELGKVGDPHKIGGILVGYYDILQKRDWPLSVLTEDVKIIRKEIAEEAAENASNG